MLLNIFDTWKYSLSFDFGFILFQLSNHRALNSVFHSDHSHQSILLSIHPCFSLFFSFSFAPLYLIHSHNIFIFIFPSNQMFNNNFQLNRFFFLKNIIKYKLEIFFPLLWNLFVCFYKFHYIFLYCVQY